MTGNRSYWIFFSCWWALCMALQAWILESLGLHRDLAFTDSAISNLLLAAACLAMGYSLRYYSPEKANSYYLLPTVTALTGVWAWASGQLLAALAADDAGYLQFLERSLPVRYCIGFLVTGSFVLLSWISQYMRKRRLDEQRKADTEKLAREAELRTLRQQLQPHFLFNTLNSISALTATSPEEARRMIHQLSDFLRGTLRKDEQQMVSLSEELNHLRLYLDIEKVRFGHRLVTDIRTEEAASSLLLPSLMLQPLVENAIKFGLYDTTGEVAIRMEALAEPGYLTVRIQNPFDPVTAAPRQGTGFGLSSVRRRLYLLFARQDLLQVRREETLFTTTIRIPQQP